MDKNTKYKELYPIYVGDRGWSLSKHPGNHGKFLDQGLTNYEYLKINRWVEEHQKYIQSLSLDTKAGIMLWGRYSRVYNEDVNQMTLLNENDENLKELFEIVPNGETVERYKYLVNAAILNAPGTPFPVYVYKILTPGKAIKIKQVSEYESFVEASFVPPEKEGKKKKDLLRIKLESMTKCLYLDAGFGYGNKILLPIGTKIYISSINVISDNKDWKSIIDCKLKFKNDKYTVVPKKYIKSDDQIFYENARKETLEETAIDIQNTGKIVEYIDFPLFEQKEYCSNYLHEAHVLVPKAHGAAASGTLFLCPEDRTILLFQRSFLGDFGGTWAGIGGAIGEERAPVYKTKFKFRCYIVEINLKTKRLWKAKNLPRINYEHLTYNWFSYDEILSQLKDFGSYHDYLEQERVTNFLRAYTSQIPLASSSLSDVRKKVLKYGKFAIYLQNKTNNMYELILPGTSYTLWKMKSYFND